MGKLFWPACALGLVVSVGLWGYGAFSVGAEVAARERAVDRKKKNLKDWAHRKDPIKNPKWLAYAKEYKSALGDEKKRLKELMLSREVKIDEFGGGNPLEMSLAQFREWLTARYAERNEKLRTAGVRFPTDPAFMGDVYNWETVRTSDYPRILREFVVTSEIAGALAAAGAQVVYEYSDKDGRRQRGEEPRKVDELKQIKFVTEPPQDPRIARPAASSPALPYSENRVGVRFVSHYNVTLDIIGKIEKSKRCLFVVRSARVLRRTYLPTDFTDESIAKRYLDSQDHESPVEVELTLGVLSFPQARQPAEEGQ